MLPPLIPRRRSQAHRSRERGVTMALVALTLLAVISMAAISIDLGSLYEAKAEAQRAADLGALAAARVISLEGITGDPTDGDGSWKNICGGATSAASVAAISIAQGQKNSVNGSPAPNVVVYYGTDTSVGTDQDCTSAGTNFAVNPVVKVSVQQPTLPTYFARIFSLVIPGAGGNSGVSATATAEVFNPSGSGSVGSGMVPVQPRCVKPWIVPNADPKSSGNKFLNADGTIVNPGISQLGPGVIGENFALNADCSSANPAGCTLLNPTPTGIAGLLQYVPATTTGTPVAVAANSSCSLSNNYQSAIAGCDQTTVYACGTPNAVTPNLTTENPVYPNAQTGDTTSAVECLTNSTVGADQLTGYPSVNYPFQIQAGFGNPLVHAGVVTSSDIITVSNNIVTIPIYDSTPGVPLPPQVTILGFLQVFIYNVDGTNGNVNVTLLNIAGCSNSALSAPTVSGTSPVPIRLITSP